MSGEEFFVQVDLTGSVTDAKSAVITAQSYEEGTKLKLICDGKVLPEDKTLAECGITATSFLVAFAKKPKKKKAVPAPTAAAPAAPVAPAASSATPTPVPSTTPTTETATTTPAPSATPSEPPAAPQQPAQPAVDPATLQQIMEISGTDENTARSALIAAFGNAERAIQYIFDPSAMPQVQQPPQQQQQQPQAQGSPSTGAPASGGANLEQLRNHPTFPQLQQLIQSNPSALPQVLRQIEQTNPQLFAVINSNPDGFVTMLNEPIAAAPTQQQPSGGGMGAMAQMMGGMGGAMPPGGMPNPAQLAGLINSLPQEARQGLAQQMGMTVEQLTAIGQQMSNMPPEQLQAMMQMSQMMGGGGGGGMPGGMPGMPGMPGGGGGGGPQQGQIQINLTPEQRQDVDSLVNMGLGSQSECLQIYLACDKDVNQAASILMDQAH